MEFAVVATEYHYGQVHTMSMVRSISSVQLSTPKLISCRASFKKEGYTVFGRFILTKVTGEIKHCMHAASQNL